MLKMLPRGKSNFRAYLAFITIQPPLSELAVAIKYLNNCSAGLSNLIMLAYFSHVANESGFMIIALGFLYFNDLCSTHFQCFELLQQDVKPILWKFEWSNQQNKVIFEYIYVVYNYISSYQNILLGIILLLRSKIQMVLLQKC